MPANFQPRPAGREDFQGISTLLRESAYTHRHLDWRHPLDILGQQPYWVIQDNLHRIVAALACLPYPPVTAWINFFAVSPATTPAQVWHVLLENVLESCPPPGIQTLAALPTQPWFARFLQEHHFNHNLNVVMLEWGGILPPNNIEAMLTSLYPMEQEDLPAVLTLDNQSFSPLWQLSEESLWKAFQEAEYAKIFLQEGCIAGYLIASITHLGGHISRLAVSEQHRTAGIGTCLVQDSLSHFVQNGIYRVTVNTQDDNEASLALYRTVNFKLTGEEIPVFVYSR